MGGRIHHVKKAAVAANVHLRGFHRALARSDKKCVDVIPLIRQGGLLGRCLRVMMSMLEMIRGVLVQLEVKFSRHN